MIGTLLKRRFGLLGVQPCSKCLDMVQEMDDQGPDWCEQHIGELVERINANIRRHRQIRVQLARAVPAELRKQWINRAIRKAIKQARKAQC